MSESTMRKSVVRALAPLNAIAVENPCLPGTPDVNYIEGWIELKWLRSWPKNEDTIVRLDHYTPQQRAWAFRRRKAGGQAWFLLQCRREWILMDAAVAALTVNHSTKVELIANATAYFSSGLSEQDLVDLLMVQQEPYTFTPEEFALLRERSQ